VELGVKGGRCGVNDEKTLSTLITHIKKYPALKLAGIEVYEGVLEHEAEVEDFLKHAIDQCNALITENTFDTQQIIITAGGSAWYDIVCKVFTKEQRSSDLKVIIRPGCYVAHDQGIYEQAQQGVLARSELACKLENELESCLEVFAYVQSLPESGRAIIGMGKRDVAFDAGMPTANTHITQQGVVSPAPSNWRVEKVMDQHAILTYDGEKFELKVGDIISFGTSHPCLTFDKWRYINVIDDNFNVMDIYKTYF
jgi:D-serine dehydratase